MPLDRQRASRKAFTLIELLVVIAIIAVLAAILFPVFSQVREKARSLACLSNMKQIGLGVQMYVQDNDERIFFRATSNAASTRTGASIAKTAPVYNSLQWWNGIMPFVKSYAVFSCPDDPGPTLSADPGGNLVIPRSYIASAAVEDLTLAQINDPAQTLVITEKWDKNAAGAAVSAPWMDAFDGDMAPDVPHTMKDVADRHQGGLNCAFFDGHAKWYRPGVLTTSRDLTGCTLIHQYPTSRMCDASVPGCTSVPPVNNLCNQFTY